MLDAFPPYHCIQENSVIAVTYAGNDLAVIAILLIIPML
jgi:hypothetical protein